MCVVADVDVDGHFCLCVRSFVCLNFFGGVMFSCVLRCVMLY